MSSDYLASPDNTQHEFDISRRAFIGAATASIVVIPAAAGGFLITPAFSSTAYADEPPNTSAGETRLIIAKANEVGVTVYDMTKNARKPVPDAKVTITSHATKKTVTVTTNSNGVAMVDITDLAEDAGKKLRVPRYEFDGQIEIVKQGYQTFRAGRIHFEGARGLAVPTRLLIYQVPYPARVAFDDWDVLYTNNEFAVAKGNVVKHTIDIEFENAGTSSLSVTLFSTDNVPIAETTVQPSGGKAKAVFQKLFLRAGHADALPTGKGFLIRYTQNGQVYQCPIALVTAKAVPGGDAAQAKPGLTFSPFGAEAMAPGLSFKIPKNWYVIGGMTFTPYIPDFKNVEYSFDPFGYFRVSWKSGEWGGSMKNKEGEWKSDGWMYSPRKSFEDNSKKVWEDRGEIAGKVWDKAYKGDKFFQTAELSRTLKANVTGQIMAAGKWDDPSGYIRGMVRASATLTLKYSLSWQFLFGYVPVLLEFDIAGMFTLGFGAAFAMPEAFSPSKIIWDFTNTGLDFTMAVIPSVSAGVGVRGIASVGVKVSATLTIFVGILGFNKLPEGADKNGISYPHVIVGLLWSISIVIMLLGHTWVPHKWEPHKYPEAYNNWKGGWQPPFGSGTIATRAVGDTTNFSSMLTEAKIITRDELQATAEYNQNSQPISTRSSSDSNDDSKPALRKSGAQDTPQFETKEDDVSIPMANGASVRYRVLSFVEKQDEEKDDKNWLIAGTSSALSDETSTTDESSAKRGAVGATTEDDKGSEATTLRAADPVDLPTVDVYGEHKHNFNMPDASVKTLASEQGLIPDSDIMLAYNIMSDTRAKVVMVCGLPLVFRIASCLVAPVYNPGQHITPDHYDPRMRVCAESLSSSSNDFKHWVLIGRGDYQIEGDPGKNPDDLYDYDFAVHAEPYMEETVDYQRNIVKQSSIVHLFIISGFRQNGDNTSLQDVAADQVLTYGKFEFYRTVNKDTGESGGYGSKLLNVRMISSNYYGSHYAPEAYYRHHSFSCPHIFFIEDGKASALYMSFLDRATTKDDKRLLFSESKEDVDICLGTMFYDLTNDTLSIPYSQDIRQLMGPIQDYSVYEMTCTERMSNGWHILMLRGNTHSHYLAVQTNARPYEEEIGPSIPAITAITYMEPRSDRLRLVKWAGHEGFLASVGGNPDEDNENTKSGAKLQHVTISGYDGVGNMQLSFEDVGSKNFNVSAFDVDPTGQFVFYPATRSGTDGGSYTDEGATKDEDFETYRIMACKLRDGKFTEPFVFAEVVHPIDSLSVFSENSSAMAFISTHITDADAGKADLWFTSMPHVRSATVVQCSTVSPYAFPGEQALFDVAVRNDGNVHLSGITANLCEKGAAVSSKATVTFSKDSIVQSSWNPVDDAGVMQNVEPDYSLAPGATSVYRVAITVPDGWSGTKTVAITASDAVAVQSSAVPTRLAKLSTRAVNDYDEWYIDYTTVLDTYPTDELLIPAGDEVDSDELEDAPITILEPQGPDAGGDGGSGGDKSSTTPPAGSPNTASSNTIGKTGDPLGGLGLAATALAAVGAAFAAYSGRRVALEHSEGSSDVIDIDACTSGSDQNNQGE